MRRVPAKSFARVCEFLTLWHAWLRCRRNKRRRPGIAAFDRNADRHLLKLRRDLLSHGYRPGPYRLSVVHDPKRRLIAAPPLIDRVVQMALLDTIGSYYERSYIEHSYACCQGRGTQRAVLQCVAWLRHYNYYLKLDIRGYFASVDHVTLRDLFAGRLSDPRTLGLIEHIIAAGGDVYQTTLARQVLSAQPTPRGVGLPLGGYFSHWCGDLYLSGLDHFVKRELKIKGYQRYLDDFVLFDHDAARLAAAKSAIVGWLADYRRLHLNPKRQHILPTTEPCTYLGYRISRAGVGIGPKAKRRLRRKLRQAQSMDTDRLVRSLRSYRGLLRTV